MVRTEQLLRGLRVGFYLHGSWLTNVRYDDSDIDVLALVADPIDEKLRLRTKQVGLDLAEERGVDLDFKVHPLEALERDPYVDLRRARLIGGLDVRALLSTPTLDALTRESVAHIGQYITDIRQRRKVAWPLSHPDDTDDFFGRMSSYSSMWYSKKLSYLASVRAACIYGISPATAVEAIEILAEAGDQYGSFVQLAVPLIRNLGEIEDAERASLIDVCERTLFLENDTLMALRYALADGTVGDKCREVAKGYVAL